MTALDEIRRGEVGDDFLALLQRTIRAVAVARNFPAPDGHDRWDANAVASAVREFLASNQTPRQLADLATLCRSDDALKHHLQESVRNHLADNGRRTPVGQLVLRINEVLATEPALERSRALLVIEGVYRRSTDCRPRCFGRRNGGGKRRSTHCSGPATGRALTPMLHPSSDSHMPL